MTLMKYIFYQLQLSRQFIPAFSLWDILPAECLSLTNHLKRFKFRPNGYLFYFLSLSLCVVKPIKGTAMQTEKALIIDLLRASKLS